MNDVTACRPTLKISLPVLVLAWSVAAGNATAGEPSVELLWPSGAPGAKGDRPSDKPTLTVYLPDRAKATVLGYRDGNLVTLRQGTGAFVCLADKPGDEGFAVACYHRLLEPYMARGRVLKAEGMKTKESIEQRWTEIDAGSLSMPRHPASMHQLFGAEPVQPDSAEGLTRLTVIYVAYATEEHVGLPSQPTGELPWLMFPGKPTAHVMISH